MRARNRPAMACAMAVLMLAGAAAADPKPFSTDPAVTAVMERMRTGDMAGGRRDLETMAKAGNADAAEVLGELLQGGLAGFTQDPPAACRYYAQASAKRGDSMHNLALCAEQGITGPVDLPLAAKLYEQAARMGMAKSNCALGNLLIAGRGVAKDAVRGHALCLAAAQAGVADAQADVGNQFLQGVGTAQDYRAARHWYQLAAEQRQHQAARTLGEMYARGDGGPQSWTEAKRLWRVAAEEGDVYAADLLSTRLTGELLAANFRPGDPKRAADIEEAIKWSELVVAHDPDPKQVEAAKGGLGILRGLQEAERQLLKK